MSPQRPDDSTELEALLGRIRPAPSDAFVDGLERRLAGRVRPGRAQRWWAPATALGGLVTGALLLALVGFGPATLSGGDDVKALAKCEGTVVWTTKRVGMIERAATGDATVVTRTRRVPEFVRRCS